jgi:signal transduction histidine kinase
MSRRAKIWILTVTLLVLTQVTASLVLATNFTLFAVSDIAQLLLLLCGFLALLPNALATHGRTRVFWSLLSAGMALWLVYQALWTYFEVYLRQDVPNPFVGDVVLFLHIVPMMAALAAQPHVEHDERTTPLGSLDFALLFVWWLYLYLFVVIPWQYAHPNETIYEHSLNLCYLAEKLAFLGTIAWLWWQSRASWRTIYANLFGATFLYASSSFVANWAIEKNLYQSGSLYDVPLVVSMAWITVIGALAYDLAPGRQPMRHLATYGVWIARVGMLAVFSLPVFASWSAFYSTAPPDVKTFRLVLTLTSVVVMGGMVFARQHLLDRELVELLDVSQQSYENLTRLQEQLLKSEKLASLGQLVGGAAHELNNPLTAMLGYSDLLADTQMTDAQRVLAQKIGQQVRRTQSLISSLISFAKQGPIENVLLDVNVLASTAIKLVQAQLQARNIELKTDFTGQLPRILGDSNQLLQVLAHFMNNVQPPLRSPAVLTVSTRLEQNLVNLELFDNGSGILQPQPTSDPFGTAKPPGLPPGVGFSACYAIIQDHGGKVAFENSPEKGAIFRIKLPIAVQTANTWSRPFGAGASA